MKLGQKILFGVCALLASIMIGEAQIGSLTTFTTSVPVATLNSNFSTLATNSLNRTGGTITGNISVNSGVTIDGVDISAVLGGSGTPTFSTVSTSNTGATSIDVAGGITAGTGNVGIVDTTGKIPGLTSTYFSSLVGTSITDVPSTTGLSVSNNSISFSAGNYAAGGLQTWGVDSGDVPIAAYMKLGTYMYLNMYATTTDVGGTANTELRYTVPCTIDGNWTGPANVMDAGTADTGVWVANNGTTYVSIYKDTTVSANWTITAADNTQVRLNAIFKCTT